GLAMAGLDTKIVGVKIVPDFVASDRVLRKLVEGLARRLHSTGVPVPDPADVVRRVELRGG
ncbi:MAG: hypothetical protein GWN71_09585, partial [Gammaproteobacteria bacterium]|nr:hypothetical protein [Gemmatimonadota bacterium]NIU73815.1 hypothetical protein [Gammaproteobacteria bacterium]